MLILASTSPRRQQLLALAGYSFQIGSVNIDETPSPEEPAPDYVMRLAAQKAQAVVEDLATELTADALVVAADTTVAVDGELLGKPQHPAEAEAMLRRLRGRTHQVYTGLVVIQGKVDNLQSELCATDVLMRDYSDAEIQEYVASGDPLDKAGGYAIQHNGFHPAAEIQGCFANVMGLPLCGLSRLLQRYNMLPKSNASVVCHGVPGQVCKVYAHVSKESPVPEHK
jgi:nucleoside triphosphate pyrophosphatase